MNQKGFTLVELIIAFAVALLAITSIASVFLIQSKALKREEMASEMRNTLSLAMDRMTLELSMAGYDPSQNADAKIVAVTASSLNFTLDENGNGLIAGDGENITYDYDTNNNTLIRNSQVIANNVTGLSFTYYDSTGTQVTSGQEEAIRRIKMNLSVRSRESLQGVGYMTHSLSSEVTPKNLAL